MGVEEQRGTGDGGGVEENVDDVCRGFEVELTGWFVGEDEARSSGQHPGDGHPLGLSSGELLGQLPRQRVETEELHRFDSRGPCGGFGCATQQQGECDVLGHIERREQRGSLEHDPDQTGA